MINKLSIVEYGQINLLHHCQLQPEKREMRIAYIQSYSCDARQRNTVHKENIVSEAPMALKFVPQRG